MSAENLNPNYIETPDDAISFVDAKNDVVADTKKGLDNLRDELAPSLSKTVETQTKSDEQYYFLGQTKVESGDLRDVTDAIESRDKLSDTKITITGGADQIFMSEVKGQQVLDTEIAKLQALKGSFSGANVTMIEQLIVELTNSTNHKNLADKYPRADKRSNLGNARLVAARIASGYTEVLTTIAAKIAETKNTMTVSYDIPWNECVIGSSGNKLVERKINVRIAMQAETPGSTIETPGSTIETPGSTIETPGSTIETPGSTIETPAITPETPVSTIETPAITPETPAITPEAPVIIPDIVDVLPLLTIQNAIANALNPQGKLIFWDGKYSYDYTNWVKLPNGDTVVSIKDKTSGKVVLDVGYTKDGVCYLGLDGYRHIVSTDATQGSLDAFVDFVSTHVVAASVTTPIFETLLAKVAEGKTAQNPVPVVQSAPSSSVEVQQGSQEIVVTFPNHQGDYVTAAGHPELFDTDGAGNFFPNITKIQAYYAKQGLDVDFVVPSQTYKTGTTLTDFSLDNGKFGGQYQDLETLKKEGKGLLIRYPDGKMVFSHTDEIQNWTTIPTGVDIAMLGSVKRPGKNLNENLLGTASPNRFLIQKTDGKAEIIVLYGNKDAQRKILENPLYERVLYLDVAGNNGQINGYWTQKDGNLVYGNTGTGDILRDGKVPTEVIKGNMPALLIMTKEKPKKVEAPVATAPVQPTVIPSKQPDPVDINLVGNTNILNDKNSLLLAILAPGVTVDLLETSLQKIKDPTLVLAIEKALIAGKSKEAMALVGMYEKSEFPSNKIPSDGKITKDILKNFEKPNRYLWDYAKILDPKNTQKLSNEFYNMGTLPLSVKNAYLGFAWNDLMKLGETESSLKQKFGDWIKKPEKLMDTAGKTYAVLSKEDAQVYLFSKDHKLVSKKSVLLGKDSHIDAFGVRNGRKEVLYRGQWIPREQAPTEKPDVIQTTPAGLFEVHGSMYSSGGLSYYKEMTPIGDKKDRTYPDQYFERDDVIVDGKLIRSPKHSIWGFHETYQKDAAERYPLYKEENIDNKLVSNGCVNVAIEPNQYVIEQLKSKGLWGSDISQSKPNFAEFWDHLQSGSRVYVTPFASTGLII